MKEARQIQQRIFFLSALVVSVLVFCGINLPQGPLIILLAVLVAVVGLPHGSLDPLVARKAGLWQKPAGLVGFITVYLLLACLAGLLWAWAPGFSLALFLAYSAWHFAGDWRDSLPSGWRFCVGATLISAPSLFHPDLVSGYFSVLTGQETPAMVRVLQWLAIPALAGTLISAIRCLRPQPVVAAELIVLALSALALPPLIFFLLYFCSLHSPRHLIETLQGLNRTAAITTAIGLTLLTIALATLFFLLSPSIPIDHRLLKITFIGLAILTVPHIILVEYHAARAATGWDSALIMK